MCVCMCVCSVIYSEARFASSCPNGVPMTLPAADLHHGGRQRKRETGGFGERRGGEGRECKDSGKVNIIFNLRILLDFLLQSRSFFLLCFLCERSCALACYIYIRPFVTMPASSRPMIYLRGRRGKRLDNIYVA